MMTSVDFDEALTSPDASLSDASLGEGDEMAMLDDMRELLVELDSGDASELAGLSGDSIAMYLREIGRAALLTAEEEVNLAIESERGNTALDQLKLGKYTPPECQILQAEVHKGDVARRRLIESNLRLVVSVARKYCGRGMVLLDLIQEGNIGLMRAVGKYDYRKGHRFSTYATWWIRQAITRALAEQPRTIRLPVHMVEAVSILNKARSRFELRGHEPSDGELAELLKWSLAKVRFVHLAAQNTTSLDISVKEGGEETLACFIPDHGDSVEKQGDAILLRESVNELLSTLNLRERRVIAMRYGLIDGYRYTLVDIAKNYGCSRERIRQIEAEALGHSLEDLLAA